MRSSARSVKLNPINIPLPPSSPSKNKQASAGTASPQTPHSCKRQGGRRWGSPFHFRGVLAAATATEFTAEAATKHRRIRPVVRWWRGSVGGVDL